MLVKVVEEAVAIEPEAAFPLVAKAFGFNRLTEEMRNDMLGLIPGLKSGGKILEQGGMLQLVK